MDRIYPSTPLQDRHESTKMTTKTFTQDSYEALAAEQGWQLPAHGVWVR